MENKELDDGLVNQTSRLKLIFRSYCSKQHFPCFYNKHNLPIELQELILARLPALKLVELKAVSRSYRLLLESSTFKERWQAIRAGCKSEILDVWVMKSTKKQEDLMAYIPAMEKYFLFLPLIYNPLVMTQHNDSLKLRGKKFLCGSGPFIVLADGDSESKQCRLLAYNMLTCQSWNIQRFYLQGPRIWRPPALITAQDYSEFYLVLETCSTRRAHSHNLDVYNSTTCSWTHHQEVSAIEANSLPVSSILSGDLFHYHADNSALYAWSVEHWYKVCVAFPCNKGLQRVPQNSGTEHTKPVAFQVYKCEGHLLLITSMVWSEQGMVLQGYIVWKLVKGETWNWVEVSQTPHELCLKSYSIKSLSDPTFMCDGHCICALSSAHEFFPPLVYDVEHDSWYHLHGVVKDMHALFTMKLIVNVLKSDFDFEEG